MAVNNAAGGGVFAVTDIKKLGKHSGLRRSSGHLFYPELFDEAGESFQNYD